MAKKHKLGKIGKVAKKVGRASAKVTAKIVKPITGVLAAAATVAFGPAAGAAIAVGGAAIARQQGATAARAKGKHGKDARTVGRKLSKQTLKIGLLGTGVGAVASAGISLATGGNVLEGVGLGQAGSKLLGSKSAAAPASEVDPLSTAKTEEDLYSAATNPGQKAADTGLLGASGWDSLRKFIPGGEKTPEGPAGEANTDTPVSFLDGIPTPVKWGAAALLALLLFSSGRGGRRAA